MKEINKRYKSVKIDKKLYDDIKKEARKEGRTIAGTIRAKYLKEKIER